jgi:hypothetical protein
MKEAKLQGRHLRAGQNLPAQRRPEAVEGLTMRTQFDWTDEEVAIIRNNYPSGGSSGCAPLLTRRTEAAIQLRASLLGVRKLRGVQHEPRKRARRELEPIPVRQPAPPTPKPQILRAADLRPGMIVNRYPVGTCAAPAPREITQAKFASAGARVFFHLAWLPVAKTDQARREFPAACWGFSRLSSLAFEVYTKPEDLTR